MNESRQATSAAIRAQYSKPGDILSTRTTRLWYSWIASEGGAFVFHEYHVNACLHLATPFGTRKQAERAEDHAFWIAVK